MGCRCVHFGRGTHGRPTTRLQGRSIRQELIQLCSESSRALGFEPVIRFDGPIDSAVDDSLADELFAVLREALTNIAKHAHANAAEVSIEVHHSQLTARVTDNGVGSHPRDSGAGRGIDNLHTRADKHDGEFHITAPDTGGTLLTWQIPLKHDG